METITEFKLAKSTINKTKKDINMSSSIFQPTRNIKKFDSFNIYNSNSNITQSLFHNYSTLKLPINSNLQKNSNEKNNFLIRLSLKKSMNTSNSNEIKDERKEFLKNKKLYTTKIRLVKKNEQKNIKRNSIYPIQEKQMKSPATIFQKIIVNLGKLKTRTNKTLEVMRENLKITREEIKRQKKQEKKMKLMSTTYIQELGDKKKIRKKKNLINFNYTNSINNSPQQSFNITNFKNNSTSNIFPNISTNNNSNNINYNYNQSTTNRSSNINIINDTGTKIKSQTKKINNIPINSPYKTYNKETFSKVTINKNSPNKSKEFNESETEKKLRLKEMPEINLSSISSSSIIVPSNRYDKNKRVYRNMCHNRNLDFSLLEVRKQLYKVYGMPALLVEQTSFNANNDMNSLLLNNKIRIIQDNIEHFKMNIMYRNDFLDAFYNMENYQKAEVNSNLEEISCILIQTIPYILQSYYETIKKLITIVIPNIKQERLKKPESEIQCLNLNYAFFNSCSEYFKICLEIYHILNKKENRFIYSITDFGILNSYLDLIRYLTNNLISMSSAFINKTKSDKKILDKMEIALDLKKPEYKEIDILERYHKRHRKQASEWELKIERVNRVLNMDAISKSQEPKDKKRYYWRKFKIKDKNSHIKKSAFNSNVFRSMLKYFKPEIKAKIIALQVVDRYEMNKRDAKNLEEEDGDNEYGNTRKVFA